MRYYIQGIPVDIEPNISLSDLRRLIEESQKTAQLWEALIDAGLRQLDAQIKANQPDPPLHPTPPPACQCIKPKPTRRLPGWCTNCSRHIKATGSAS